MQRVIHICTSHWVNAAHEVLLTGQISAAARSPGGTVQSSGRDTAGSSASAAGQKGCQCTPHATSTASLSAVRLLMAPSTRTTWPSGYLEPGCQPSTLSTSLCPTRRRACLVRTRMYGNRLSYGTHSTASCRMS
eukprot:CAMPEP_0202909326 /NCGR_PEP_ID=MMETSP1392-20130828/49026_1 /ASSEMBLY_ACC=CAM_ASM_000868 /TAXON_ID=225041 /ORGANISM="Chlamydomonas chlamydogama, Strain SAG 11-48b" /LENGTH=133 /DNA_ID=CAMNT_0049599037 /DNA_START=31 /DNA_END=433 /DNA_ORIENTATION=-